MLTLAEEDVNIVVCEAYEKVVKAIEALGRRALALALDVTDSESVVQGVDKAISYFLTG